MYRDGGFGVVFRMLNGVAEVYNYKKKAWVESELAFDAFAGEADSFPLTRKEALDIIASYESKYALSGEQV